MFLRHQIHRRIMGPSAFFAATLALSGASAQTLYSEGAIIEMLGFGSDVAVASGRVFVGEAGRIMGPGAVFSYENGDEGWAEAAEITSRDGLIGDGFGAILAGDGDVLLVTAPAAGQGRGQLYVFEHDEQSGEWHEVGAFGPDSEQFGGFASSTAVHGDLIAIGWPAYGRLTGKVEILRRGPAGWVRSASLSPPDFVSGAAFGAAVAVHGDRVLVSAPLANHRAGAAYEYRTTEGEAEFVGELEVEGLVPNALFGVSLEYDGVRAVVGAPNASLTGGAVYVFQRDPTAGRWTQDGVLSSPEGLGHDAFGVTCALSEGSIWAGAPGANRARGGAYVYEAGVSGTWTDGGLITLEDAVRGDAFGVSVAADSNQKLAAAASTSADHDAGTVIIFERTDDGWSASAEIASEPETLADS